MAHRNIYEERFNQVSDSRNLNDDIRRKLVEGLVDLNGQKKIYNVKQKEFSESDIELSKIRAANRDLKETLIETLIQKEELISQKKSLISAIEMLKQQIENLEKETNIMLSDEGLEQVCNRFSTRAQQSLLNKILDAKCKLLELGVPLSDINNAAISE